jgi:plasmid maintenance system antidote protein VapI
MQPSHRVPTHPGEILREEFLVDASRFSWTLA